MSEKNENKFKKRLQIIPSDINQILLDIDLLKDKWVSGADLGRQRLDSLKKTVLVTSTGASTRIEGSQLSDEDVERLIRGLSMQKFKDRDKQEVQGYYEILDNVFDSYRSISFSESTIKFFHKELLKYSDKDDRHRGGYKTSENKVGMLGSDGQVAQILFDTTPAWLTPKEMLELVEWTQNEILKKEIHPLLIIGNFVVEFLLIHPFTDGNGRLSRILTNLMMLQNGYEYVAYVSQEKLIEDNKPEYYVSLRRSQKTLRDEEQDIMSWLGFFLKIVKEQTSKAVLLLTKEATNDLLSPKQQFVWDFIHKSQGYVTPKEIESGTGVSRPTINQSLSKLLKLKWIVRSGEGRAVRYQKI